MATSPNYAWAEPDNSSLVKNGASDIRTLGDAIDTSVWNSGFGQAGKNKIINGDFGINQRSFTSTTADNTFTFDRWRTFKGGSGTSTYSAETFTIGAAPVAGYEARNFARIVTTGQSAVSDYAIYLNLIESVRTFAAQTATISFWAKAATGTPKIALEMLQNFGTGGSPSSSVNTSAGAVTISTSWVRYSITVPIPSISGKTLGTAGNDYLGAYFWVSAGSNFNARASSIGNQNNTFDIWGVQAEYGSKATPFQTASGGSPQAELAMCQRYYYRATASAIANRFGYGTNISTTEAQIMMSFPVTMRTAPTAVEQTGTAGDYSITEPAGATAACTSVPSFLQATTFNGIWTLTSTVGTLTQFRSSAARANVATAYLGWSAEL